MAGDMSVRVSFRGAVSTFAFDSEVRQTACLIACPLAHVMSRRVLSLGPLTDGARTLSYRGAMGAVWAVRMSERARAGAPGRAL